MKTFKLLNALAKKRKAKIYLVGGYLRDLILERKNKDLDFVLTGRLTDFVKEFAKNQRHKNPFLSNRLAIWINRLHIIVESDPNIRKKMQPTRLITDKPNLWPQWVDDLVHVAMFYSNYEIGCELSRVPVNTVWFDAPNIDRIKYNIAMYQKDSPFITGLYDLNEQEIIEKYKNVDARTLINKGGKKK